MPLPRSEAEQRSVETLLRQQGCLLQPFHRLYWLGLSLDQQATLGSGGGHGAAQLRPHHTSWLRRTPEQAWHTSLHTKQV